MSTCISRRAHADRNTFRLINDKGENGRQIWIEYRCPNVVSGENEICVGCSVKLPKYKYQANQKCNHGIINGPYHSDSKLYGSPYYLNEVKNGWRASETDEFRAKAAVDKALSMAPRKKSQVVAEPVLTPVPEPIAPAVVNTQTIVTAEPVVEEKKKRAYVRKKPLEARVSKTKKVEILLPQAPVLEIPSDICPKFVEVVAPPITITDFVVVKVKKIKCQGKDYYYDSSSGKVYGISVNGVGAYKGRFKEDDDVVDTTFPDSDCE